MPAIPEIVLPAAASGQSFRLAAWFRDGGPDLLLFVHGLAASKQNFAAAWSRPEFRHHALLAFDWPGFGRSPRPDHYACALDSQARLLNSVLDRHASRRIHLVAHSLGGSIAMLLGRRSLARLCSLTLVEARLLRSSCGVTGQTAALTFEEFHKDLLPRFRRKVAADPRAAFDVERAEPQAFYASACSLIEQVEGGRLLKSFVDAPCRRRFIYGSDNRHLAELRVLAPELTYEIDAAGHFPMHDNPTGFWSWCARFFQGEI